MGWRTCAGGVWTADYRIFDTLRVRFPSVTALTPVVLLSIEFTLQPVYDVYAFVNTPVDS